MSRIIKGIGKVFKKVAKVVKKIAVPALALGAIVFTGGAALGLAPMAGGWGAAVSGVVSNLGVSGGIAKALTGAITFAGYGAATGGITAAATGGSITDGMNAGALAGAAIGATGILSDPFSGIGMGKTATAGLAPSAAPTQVGQAAGIKTTSVSTGSAISAPMTAPTSTATASTASKGLGTAVAGGSTPAVPVAVSGSAGASSAASSGGGLLSRVGSWANNNPVVAGSMISGIGSGISNYAAARAGADSERELMEQRQSLIAQNYEGADPGAGFNGLARGKSGKTPAQRFDPGDYGSFEYRYNPETARIERTPVDG